MFWFELLLAFVFGTCIGSFLNVVIYRTSVGESIAKGRSKCPHCKHTIPFYMNIPVLSFFLLKGKCAFCRGSISWQYPLIEAMTGIMFVWWLIIGKTFFLLSTAPFIYLQPLFWLFVSLILFLIVVFDIKYMIIPDFLNLSLLLVTLIYRGLLTKSGIMLEIDFVNYLVMAFCAGMFFYGLHLLTAGKGFGLGDVKYGFGMGLLLGWPLTLVAVFMSFIFGSIYAIPVLLLGKKQIGQKVPFGPFLVMATVFSLVWGDKLFGWYLGLL